MKGSYFFFAPIILGGIILAASCFDTGVMDLDDGRLTTPVCSDLPQNDPRVIAGDCVTSRDVLNVDRTDTNWLWFVVGLGVSAIGAAGVAGYLPFGKKETTPPRMSPHNYPPPPRPESSPKRPSGPGEML